MGAGWGARPEVGGHCRAAAKCGEPSLEGLATESRGEDKGREKTAEIRRVRNKVVGEGEIARERDRWDGSSRSGVREAGVSRPPALQSSFAVTTVTTLLQAPPPPVTHSCQPHILIQGCLRAVPSELRARFNSFHAEDIPTFLQWRNGPGVTWESHGLS